MSHNSQGVEELKKYRFNIQLILPVEIFYNVGIDALHFEELYV